MRINGEQRMHFLGRERTELKVERVANRERGGGGRTGVRVHGEQRMHFLGREKTELKVERVAKRERCEKTNCFVLMKCPSTSVLMFIGTGPFVMINLATSPTCMLSFP